MSVEQDPRRDVNERAPNFRDEEGRLYLIRCFRCSPGDNGRENYGPAVATGRCVWCGWRAAIDQAMDAEEGE